MTVSLIKTDPYADMIEALMQSITARVIDLLNRVADACREDGLHVPNDPFEMHDDDYRWCLFVWRSPEERERDPEAGVDIILEIAEERDYDDETGYGVNFGVHATEQGGRMLGGIEPYNFTPEVWIDIRDSEAVLQRFELLENAHPEEMSDLITARDARKETT